ncbi:hypothetical protein PKOR_01250 [Pontibacter korlensis]|uniref:Uncharacterized protein n=1 Tax=Pontibacter korlensis TaxID=400092 RepID=A0A0E3UVP4_9BACT|nr:hypothetical protein PKOR_01250 [Pontibacter korlensis]
MLRRPARTARSGARSSFRHAARWPPGQDKASWPRGHQSRKYNNKGSKAMDEQQLVRSLPQAVNCCSYESIPKALYTTNPIAFTLKNTIFNIETNLKLNT